MMLKYPLISFVVTSYNYEKFIVKTLESILAQTYKNYEIVVVDDYSSDNSVAKVEEFISLHQDVRITLVKHSSNMGQLAAMMSGLKTARGQFISFIDSDDLLVEEYAAAHLRVHLSTSVAFTSAQIIEIDENDEIHTINSISSPHRTSCLEPKTLDELLKVDVEHIDYDILKRSRFGGWYWSPNSAIMYRKSAIEIVLKYKHPEKWKICPDKFLCNFANLVGGSAIIYVPLVAYRRHGQNAGGSDYIVGNHKYNSDKTTCVNVANNIKIRPETLKFLIENRSDFVAKFGTRGYIKMILSVLF